LGAVVEILTLFKREIIRDEWGVSGRWKFQRGQLLRFEIPETSNDRLLLLQDQLNGITNPAADCGALRQDE